MGFLGSVILSFAFSMFKQRKVVFFYQREKGSFPDIGWDEKFSTFIKYQLIKA